MAAVACVLFAVAAILSGTGTHINSDWFSPTTLAYFGGAFLALHFCWGWVRRG
jgi:hypothetical protein